MAERGTKRKCASCGASYYDLNKTPIRCPKCDAPYVATVPLRGPALRGRVAPPPPVDIEPREEEHEEEREAGSEGGDEFEEAEDLPSDDETFGTGDDEERD